MFHWLKKIFGKSEPERITSGRMKLSPASPQTDHIRSLKQWFQELEEDTDGLGSLQYEVIDAILVLRYTRDRDGWCNWDESYYNYLDTLGRWLPTPASGDRIVQDLAAVKQAGDAGADAGDFADAEMDRLTMDVFLWCRKHSEVLLLPEGYDFWSDVLVDAIT
ncbi:MAG: hypothetical protein JWM68_2038 [Verrucomicrobiales bacterium]|nr:hypothetical protein [Verrucomicrobiales bacterium]